MLQEVRSSISSSKMAVLVFVYFSFMIMYARAQRVGDTSLVHEWKTLDFEWPSEEKKLEAIKNKTYIPERNMVAGIKVSIFVSLHILSNIYFGASSV